MAGLAILILLAAAVVGLFYAWSEWRKQLRLVQVRSWRRVTLSVGLFAVTLQAFLFVSLWTPLSRFHVLLRRSVNAELLLMMLALPCIFTWKGRARWWLLTATIGFVIGSFFLVLAELAY
jgi:hypothetical protein